MQNTLFLYTLVYEFVKDPFQLIRKFPWYGVEAYLTLKKLKSNRVSMALLNCVDVGFSRH